jgi:hypothetical protein
MMIMLKAVALNAAVGRDWRDDGGRGRIRRETTHETDHTGSQCTDSGTQNRPEPIDAGDALRSDAALQCGYQW